MKKDLVIKRVKFDIKKIADGFNISEEEAIVVFKDGRFISRLTETMIRELEGVKIHKSAVQKESDGVIECKGKCDDIKLSSKTLTDNGVKFQQSKYVGQSRTCSKENLKKSIKLCERIFVVDIRAFPVVSEIVITAVLLMEWFNDGYLTQYGLKAEKFYKLLQSEYNLVQEFYQYDSLKKIYIKTNEVLADDIAEIAKTDSILDAPSKKDDFYNNLA